MRIAVVLLAACGVVYATDVLTHHNNLGRTGAVLDEKLLSPSSVKGQAFGKLFSVAVDGQIYAQPLIVTGLAIPGKGTHNVVFVATMRNMVYAFDADAAQPTPLWQVNLGAPMPYDRFMEREGVPVYRGIGVRRVQDLPLAPWKRLGGRGSFIGTRPERMYVSIGLTATALTRTITSPSLAVGAGRSS